MKLFDEFARTEASAATRGTRIFDFWNSSAWEAAQNIRDVLEDWFSNIPEIEQQELRSRFRSDNQNHASAFFELLLHQLLFRFQLQAFEFQPPRQGAKSKPDFFISSERSSCYVEANVMGLKGFMADNPLENMVFDAIDEIASETPTRVSFMADTEGVLTKTPSLSKIKSKVRRWLRDLDKSTIKPGRFRSNPFMDIEDGDWRLRLQAFAYHERPLDRLVGGSAKGGVDTTKTDLRTNILAKNRQHRGLEYPLMIAMNTQSGFQDPDDEVDAIFGDLRLTIRVGANSAQQERVSRGSEGVWHRHGSIRNQNLHGVLFFRGVFPNNVHSAKTCLYINPYVETSLPDELMQLGTACVVDSELQYKPGRSLGEILDLPRDWPGPRK